MVDTVARKSYGYLLAAVCRRTRDIASGEDALAEAFRDALEQWPAQGIPASPEAWLLTAARRRVIDQHRRDRVIFDSDLLDELNPVSKQGEGAAHVEYGDPRISLLFVCAHPAIRKDCHTPLMLQTVLGLSAERIAGLLLVSPAGLRQRLLRAKNKIRESGIPFVVPSLTEAPARLDAVLEAIYGIFSANYLQLGYSSNDVEDLTQEAIYLVNCVAALLPADPEVHGLAALLKLIQARSEARSGQDGFIPLERQEAASWDRKSVDVARGHLRVAAAARRVGRFQLEAAIQLAHMAPIDGREVNWNNIVQLYANLREYAPTVGALIGEAAALGNAKGSESGLALLDTIEAEVVGAFQPFWCVRAHLLRKAGRIDEAKKAYVRAIGLTSDPSLRAFLISEQPG